MVILLGGRCGRSAASGTVFGGSSVFNQLYQVQNCRFVNVDTFDNFCGTQLTLEHFNDSLSVNARKAGHRVF